MINCIKCKKELPEGSLYCCYCGKKQSAVNSKAKRTRGNGQGTAYKRGKTWTLQYRKYTDDDGSLLPSPINRTKGGFSTKRDALDYLPIIIKETEKKKVWLTFLQVYEKWEPTHIASKSTKNCYHAALNYFAPIWNERFCDIDIDDLQECLDDCEQGKRTKQNMKTLAGLLYKYALPRHQTLDNLNLATFVTVRDDGEVRHKPGLSLAELELVKQAAEDGDAFAELVYADCYLGFRPTGFLTLDVSNYDPVEKAIRGGTKTEAGKNRIVTIPPKIQHIVDKYTKGKTEGPIFTDADGNPLSIKAYRSGFYDLLDRLNIPNPIRDDGTHTLSPHSCRHTFATLMKAVNAPDKDKLALIGHTKVEMLQHYQDTHLDDLRRITDNL